jgi:hypothetical protein
MGKIQKSQDRYQWRAIAVYVEETKVHDWTAAPAGEGGHNTY